MVGALHIYEFSLSTSDIALSFVLSVLIFITVSKSSTSDDCILQTDPPSAKNSESVVIFRPDTLIVLI